MSEMIIQLIMLGFGIACILVGYKLLGIETTLGFLT